MRIETASQSVIEYNFQLYCGNYGQYINWSKPDSVKEEFIKWDGVEDD